MFYSPFPALKAVQVRGCVSFHAQEREFYHGKETIPGFFFLRAAIRKQSNCVVFYCKIAYNNLYEPNCTIALVYSVSGIKRNAVSTRLQNINLYNKQLNLYKFMHSQV